jgi:hypothetical protein
MRKLLTAGALLLASSQAFSGIVTETASFGTQSSITDQAIGFGINETVTINAFDTALGNLTGVSIDVFSQIDTEGRSTNTSGLNGQSQFRFNLDSDWTVSSSVGDHTFNTAGNIFTETDAEHQIGEIFDYGRLDIFKSGSFASTDFAAFTSDIDFNFVIAATSSFINIANGGQALFTNQIDSAAWGQVEVTYTFEDAPTSSIPEPTSLAIFGLGIAGFAFSRKTKKSA